MNKNRSKIMAALFLLFLSAFCLTGCNKAADQGQSNKPLSIQTNPSQNDSNLKTFTLQELKTFDGKNGNPAYVAVNGKVYDVSKSSAWRNGLHAGYKAGEDLTNDMQNSPHGVRVLEGLPVVGKLANNQ